MRIIDLFSGAGGLTFGFYYRLYKNRFVRNKKNLFVFANEFNKSASDAFSVNYPDITMLNSDIKDLTEDQIKKLVGEDPVDIIIGGPPCQSYSTVGPRNYDERAVLYQEYSRILGIVRPKMFLFENVRGILSMREVFYKKDENGNIEYELTNIEGKESVRPRKRPVVDHYGEKLMDKMEALFGNINGDLGYNIRYKVLNSVDYGVPENRDRVFIVGIRKDLGIKWEFPKPVPGMHLSVREAISDLPPVSEGESVSDYKSTAQNDYQRLMRHGSSVLTQHYCGVYGDKMRVVIHNVKQGQGRNDFNKLIDAGVIEKKYKLTSGCNIREKLLALKEQQKENKRICGNCYNREYDGYVFVDVMGNIFNPRNLSSNFSKLLELKGLRHIRFHDLRHSCASLLLANDVPMKQIQEWLGHSDISTTANIYSHLDYKSKLTSANVMDNVLTLPETETVGWQK